MICCLQGRGPGKLATRFQSKLKGLRTREASGVSPGPSLKAWEPWGPMCKGRRRWTSQFKEREWICPSIFLLCLGSQWIGWCLPALVRMMLTQSLLTDMPRKNVWPAVWASHKINHHSQQTSADSSGIKVSILLSITLLPSRVFDSVNFSFLISKVRVCQSVS